MHGKQRVDDEKMQLPVGVQSKEDTHDPRRIHLQQTSLFIINTLASNNISWKNSNSPLMEKKTFLHDCSESSNAIRP
jgi:hypothetical protein